MKERATNLFRIAAFLLPVIIIVNCSQKSNQQVGDTLTPLTLTQELTISTDHEEALAGDFSGLAVADDGTIYAADTRRQIIHVFSPVGAYVDSIGRKGKGPGEFQDLDRDINVQSDTLYALQQNPRRIELFNTQSRKAIRTITIPDIAIKDTPVGSPRKIFPQPDGSIVVHFLNPYLNIPEEFGIEEESLDKKFNTISILSPDGYFINKNVVQVPTLYPSAQRLVYMQPRSINIFTTTFYPALQVAIDQIGQVYLGVTDSLVLRKYDEKGAVTGTIKANYLPLMFTDADLDSLAKEKNSEFTDAVEKVGAPERWPAFQKFFVDDEGRCWVQLMNPGNADQTWWVFDDEGNPQWTFSLPTEVKLFEVQQGKAYGIFQSPEHLPEIRRYDVAM